MNGAGPSGSHPVVSVAMLAYNHERYVRQALDSVLGQVTNFPYEVVLGEDCSRDGTRAIVQEYQQRWPDRVRLLLPERNIGMVANFTATLSACRAPWMAFLDADDYWVSKHKLQTQYDFMLAHPTLQGCAHRVEFIDAQGQSKGTYPQDDQHPQLLTMDDYLKDVIGFATGSLFFRNCIRTIPPGFLDGAAPDWLLKFTLLQQGPLGYLPDVMGANRLHEAGAWNSLSTIRQNETCLRLLRKVRPLVTPAQRRLIRETEKGLYLQIAHIEKAAGHTTQALRAEIHAAKRTPWRRLWPARPILAAADSLRQRFGQASSIEPKDGKT